ncbi:MAG: glycolate oxidase subunit GlcF [Gammaproteobacteria bacterium]|nr:glycolate oxidase subunit GlcF [Gammaproteobacteria bacterium]
MRTEFSIEQLQNAGLAEMESILRKCVHCGFCNATCPTYRLTGDELDGPRGRIYLMKDMLEHGSKPVSEVVRHIDRCLSCLSCTSTCPSGVDYMHLVDHSRAYIEKRYTRSLFDRFYRALLANVLPSPDRFRTLIRLAKLLSWCRPLLPSTVSASIKLAVNSQISTGQAHAGSVFKTNKQKRGTVALLQGCAQQVIGKHINDATIRILNRSGFDVHILNENECCAAIEHHLGKEQRALERIKTNLKSWASQLPQFDALISNASGCGTMLKDYGHLLKSDPEYSSLASLVSGKTKDICEFLHENESLVFSTPRNNKITYQNPCSMQHGQRLSKQPLSLLEQAGYKIESLPDSHICCGSAGTYNILQSDLAEKLGQQKTQQLESTGADIIASGNLGCMTQLQQYSGLPLVHTIELLDWASSGPTPMALNKNF